MYASTVRACQNVKLRLNISKSRGIRLEKAVRELTDAEMTAFQDAHGWDPTKLEFNAQNKSNMKICEAWWCGCCLRSR